MALTTTNFVSHSHIIVFSTTTAPKSSMSTPGSVLLAPSPSGDFAQYDTMYYLKGAAAGGICCSITHGALTPVDVVVSHDFLTALGFSTRTRRNVQRRKLGDDDGESNPCFQVWTMNRIDCSRHSWL